MCNTLTRFLAVFFAESDVYYLVDTDLKRRAIGDTDLIDISVANRLKHDDTDFNALVLICAACLCGYSASLVSSCVPLCEKRTDFYICRST